ncbi:hypothetical protein KSK55_06715 [Methanospirillum purgamenti]|uniref:Uncharacterized protein n=1 Tax=Methanospirillum hungatei TaxID=2203 RepID=A0A8F5VPJ6_METHU|nr:hypothetical protein [Methanospirillum hungatei]QXO96056.1 hypothetical protein KSK55_06715 [Methanospirillum hungatei]
MKFVLVRRKESEDMKLSPDRGSSLYGMSWIQQSRGHVEHYSPTEILSVILELLPGFFAGLLM